MLLLVPALGAFGIEDIYVTDTVKTLSPEMELRNLYLQALCFKKQGRADSALLFLNKYVERDTTNGAVYMDIANMYISAGNYKESLANMRKAAKLEPNNYWIRRSEALLLIQNGKTEDGLKVYEQIVKDNPEKVDDIASLATLYGRVGKKREALNAWNHYANQMGVTENVSITKFDLLYSLGEKKYAEAVLDSLIATDPTIPHFYIVKANSYAYKAEFKKAEKILFAAKKKFPNESAIDQELSLVYLESNQTKKAVKSIKGLLSSPGVDFEAKRTLLVSSVADSAMSPYFGNADYEQLIQQYPKNDQAYLIYSDYLLGKRDNKGIDYLKKAVDVNPNNELAWVSLLSYYEGLDKTTYTVLLEKALNALPESGQLLFYKGTLSASNKNRQLALECWQKSADILAKNPNEKMRASLVYGIVGDTYMELKDTVNAFVYYDKSLLYNTNNTSVLNNYAYFLSEMNIDLERAERMSGMAIAAEPKNVTFLDTYAWVLFKLQRFSTARLYQEQAVMLGGEKEIDIMEHYGDILYKDGDKNAAREAWNKAVKLTDKPSAKLKQKAETGVYVE